MKGKSFAPKLSDDDFNLILSYFPSGIIFFDMETTGLSPLANRIIELSAVKIDKNKKISIFDNLINPEIPIPPHTSEIHGINDEDVKEAPKIKNVLTEFLKFSETLPLIAHNAKFDAGFLVYHSHLNEILLPSISVYCSYLMSKSSFPNLSSYKLKNLSEHFHIKLERHHRALDDTWACLYLVLACLREFSEMQKKLPKESYLFSLKDFKEKSFPIPEHLENKGLSSFVDKQVPLSILYSGGSHKGIFRPIIPLSLLPLPQGNYLYGLCLLSQKHKSFSLKKIVDIKKKKAD